MSKYVERLIEFLATEEAVYKQLLDYSDLKRKAIVDGDIEELDRIVTEEEQLIDQITKAENARNLLTDEMSGTYNVPAESITVTSWPEKIDEETSSKLEMLQNQLQEVLQELDRQNQINAKLIEVHLSYIDFLFDSATHTKETTAYSADGSLESKKSQAANLFDETM